jgi:hypothetical protein
MAEIGLHVLNSQWLDRRIGDLDEITRKIRAWKRDRNNKDAKISWQFTNEKARIKLKKLYQTISN